MFRTIALLLTLVACQVDEDDNYYRYEGRPPTDLAAVFNGDWSNGQDFLRVEAGVFQCDSGDGIKEATIIEVQQKYFLLDQEACGYGPVVAFSCRPPYDALSLMRDGKWVQLWKR